MKQISRMAKKELPMPTKPQIVNMIASVGGWKKLNQPMLSTDVKCLICNGDAHYTWPVDAKNESGNRVWFCANAYCETMETKNRPTSISTPPPLKRAVLWPLFCEIMGIGDLLHDVRFELIDQSKEKLSYLLKFSQKPTGLIYMTGSKGTGKTYACLGLCELYTRKSTSCMFLSQRKLYDEWLKNTDNQSHSHFLEKVSTNELLVVDDFGTGEISTKFMTYFMDLINTRLQWSNRGTVINTNLDDQTLVKICGDALSDRLRTGQIFQFTGETRRKKAIL